MLNTYIDSEGNLIADLANQYRDLITQKENNYQQSLKEYELSLKRRASDPAYALSQSGTLVNENAFSFGQNSANQLSIFGQSKDWASYASSLSKQVLDSFDGNMALKIASEGTIDKIIESIANGSTTLDTLLEKGNDIEKKIASKLKTLGYETSTLQNLSNQYDTIKYGADKDLATLAKTKISNIASETEDKTLANLINTKLNQMWDNAIKNMKDGETIVDGYNDFFNEVGKAVDGIVLKYEYELSQYSEDIAAITGSKYELSLKAYTELDRAVRSYFDPDSSLGIWIKNVTDANKEITGIGVLGALESFHISNQNKIIEVRTSLDELDPSK